jgi:uncharacterized membrane protein
MAGKKRIMLALNIFLVLGMLVSLFLLYEHFAETGSEFCSFNGDFDCGIVNKSPYANLDGISYLLTIDLGLPIGLINISGINFFFDFLTANAFLGFLTLLFVYLLVSNSRKGKGFLWISGDGGLKWVRGILIFGVAYGFYLFLIQHFVLKTYCIFCLTLDVILVVCLILAWRLKK